MNLSQSPMPDAANLPTTTPDGTTRDRAVLLDGKVVSASIREEIAAEVRELIANKADVSAFVPGAVRP
jgi:hypothetical protein